LWRQYFAYGRGRSRTIRRHPDSWRLRQLAVPVHTAMLLASLPLAALISWALLWPVIYGLILASVSAGLAIRHRAWRGLLAAPVAAAIHTGWGLGFLHGLLTLDEAPWRHSAPRPSRVSNQVPKTQA
jgi:succinoglycan biosynthesis protein ExoA